MGEKQRLISRRFSYEGIFNYREFFRIYDSWLREKFYDKYEGRTEQYDDERGMHINTEFIPWKKVTDYHKYILKMEIAGADIKEVEVVKEGKKIRMHHGKLNIQITGYFVVDYPDVGLGKWNKPLHYFMRDMYDKYIYWRMTKKYMALLVEHTNDLSHVLKSYLNMGQYRLS